MVACSCIFGPIFEKKNEIASCRSTRIYMISLYSFCLVSVNHENISLLDMTKDLSLQLTVLSRSVIVA